jgi:membrane protease YdiL (CAAX protease family)
VQKKHMGEPPDIALSSIDRATQTRDLAFFVVAFLCIWSVAVWIIWVENTVPQPFRPLARNSLWLGAALTWIAWKRPPNPMRFLGLLPLTGSAVASGLIALLVLLLWNVIRIHTLAVPTHALSTWAWDRWIWSLTGVFVEELVFRGVVLTGALQCTSAPWAIVATAAAFLTAHIPGWTLLNIPVDNAEIATVFLVGIIAGWLRWITKSLWPAVAMHWANNLGAAL